MNALDPKAFKDYLAKTEHEAKVKSASVFLHQLIESFEKPKALTGDVLPSQWSENKFRFRKGEVTLWTGFNGHGKSMILGQSVMNFMLTAGKKACIASMEMQPWDTLNRMSRQFFKESKPQKEDLATFVETIKDHCYIYDHVGTVRSGDLLDAIAYCGHALKLDHFVVDSLLKTDIADDDLNGQKRFVDNICAIAKDTGMHVHLVAHARKGKDEDSPPGKMDVRGSGSLTDQVDNVLSMWQVKTDKARKDFSGVDAILNCSKQRHGGWEGDIPLVFNKTSLCFEDAAFSDCSGSSKEKF